MWGSDLRTMPGSLQDFNLAASGSDRGEHVLYWMRTGLRGHENPALDVARAAAARQGVPLRIAAFLLRSHTHPTARRYTFWMQGLQETQLELRRLVLSHAVTCAICPVSSHNSSCKRSSIIG